MEKLHSFTSGEIPIGLGFEKALESQEGLVFAYTGMGPQWWGMGRELLNNQPIFRKKVEDCDA